MRRLLALCLLVTACTAQPPAKAAPPPPDPVRYAFGGDCFGVGECGSWYLMHRSGKTAKFSEARIEPDDDSVYLRAAFAVSADGMTLAYYRGERLTVRRLTGSVVDLGAATFDSLRLSPDGTRLVASEGGREIMLFDTATGLRVWSVERSGDVASLSGDRLLLTRLTSLNTTDLAVYDERGKLTRVDTPPQVVAANAPYALAPDGRVVATIAVGSGKLRLYDLPAGRVTREVGVAVPGKHRIEALYWSGAHRLTVTSCHSTAHSTFHVDARTGAVEPVDSYRASKGVYDCEPEEE
jgi:WD40 repeat protein